MRLMMKNEGWRRGFSPVVGGGGEWSFGGCWMFTVRIPAKVL